MFTRLLLLAGTIPAFMSAAAIVHTDTYTFTAPQIDDSTLNGTELDAHTWGFTITSLGPLTSQNSYDVVLNGSPNSNYVFQGASGTSVTDQGGYDLYGPELTFQNPQTFALLEFDFLGTSDFWQSVTPAPVQFTAADYGQSATNSGADWTLFFAEPPCNACFVSLPNNSAVSPEPASWLMLAGGIFVAALALRKARTARQAA